MSESGASKLSPACVDMNVCGIKMLGQSETGAFIGLNDEGAALLARLRAGEIPQPLSENQRQMMKALAENGFLKEPPLQMGLQTAYLHVTSRCDLSCAGCYSYENERNERKDLGTEGMKFIIRNLKEAGLGRLVISGGEPFLRPDISDIIASTKIAACVPHVACITNGSAQLHRYKEVSQYLDSLHFSLDAHDDRSATIRPNYIFDDVVEKIVKLKEYGMNVALVFTLHKRNFENIDKMGQLAAGLGIPFNFSMLSVAKPDRTGYNLALGEEEFAALGDRIKNDGRAYPIQDSSVGAKLACKTLCGAGRTTVSVSSDGWVYPCHMFNGYRDFRIVTALVPGLLERMKCKENIFLHMTVDDIEACKSCNVRYLCGGGCRFRGYADSGSASGTDKMCGATLAYVESAIKQMAKK